MESIGLCAFENCFSLRLVYIPKSVKSLENNAFIGCKNLLICIEVNEYEYKNGEYSYYGLDNLLNKLDGTHNKGKLGANAILGVSLATVKAVANAKQRICNSQTIFIESKTI